MRFRDYTCDVSDSTSDEAPNDFSKYGNNSTVQARRMVSSTVMFGDHEPSNAGKHLSQLLSNQRLHDQRPTSPLSVHSVQSFQHSMGPPNSNSLQRNVVDQMRGVSPMSLRSVSNFGSNTSSFDLITLLQNNVNNLDRHDINKMLSILKKKIHKRRPKRKKLRTYVKGTHLRYGGDSGEQGSNSSVSSDDGKSIRSSATAYRNTNYSINNHSRRFNRRNYDNRSLRSMPQTSNYNALLSRAHHSHESDNYSIVTADYNRTDRSVSLKNKYNNVLGSITNDFESSRISCQRSIDDDNRSVRTMPSTFKPSISNCNFKNMFNLPSKTHRDISNETKSARSFRSQWDNFSRQNISRLPSQMLDRSASILPIEEKDEDSEASGEQMMRTNSIRLNINNDTQSSNKRNDKSQCSSYDIRVENNKRLVATVNTHNDDNRSVRSEPSMFAKPSKSKFKNTFDVVPRSQNNVLCQNLNSKSQNMSMMRHKVLLLPLNTHSKSNRVQTITEENDEDKESTDEMPPITDQYELNGKHNHRKETDKIITERNQLVANHCTEKDTNPSNMPNKEDDNISVKSVPSTFNYNSTLCKKTITNYKNIYTSKSNLFSNPIIQNSQLDPKFGKPTVIDKLTAMFLNDEENEENHHPEEQLIASGGTVANKNKTKFTKVYKNSDEDENIFYTSNVNKQQSNIQDNAQPSTSNNDTFKKHYPWKSNMKSTSDFIFARPKTPKPKATTGHKNNTITSKAQMHEPPKCLPESSKNNIKDACEEASQQSVSDVSLRPSFIRRKLFTQTLEITEDMQNEGSDSPPHSPVSNIYSMKPNYRKTGRSLLPKSLLRVDIDDEGRRNQFNSQSVPKILPQGRVSEITQNSKKLWYFQEHNESTDDDRCNVLSLMSMYNKDDISDTYSDNEGENIVLENEVFKNGNINDKVCQGGLKESILNEKKDIKEQKTIGQKNSDVKQVKSKNKQNLDKKQTGRVTKNEPINATSAKNKSTKNRLNEEMKTHDKIKETLKPKRKRSFADLNDSYDLDTPNRRAKRYCGTQVVDNNGISHDRNQTSNKVATKKPNTNTEKESKKANAQAPKNTTDLLKKKQKLVDKGNAKKVEQRPTVKNKPNSPNRSLLDKINLTTLKSVNNRRTENNELNENKKIQNNKNPKTIRITRNSLNKSTSYQLDGSALESVYNKKSDKNKLNEKKASQNNKGNTNTTEEVSTNIRITRNSLNRSQSDQLNLSALESIRNRRFDKNKLNEKKEIQNDNDNNKTLEAIPTNIRITRNSLNRSLSDQLNPSALESIRNRRYDKNELNEKKRIQNNNDNNITRNAIPTNIRITRNSLNRSLSDQLNLSALESIRNKRFDKNELKEKKKIQNNNDNNKTVEVIPTNIRITHNSLNRSLSDQLNPLALESVRNRKCEKKEISAKNIVNIKDKKTDKSALNRRKSKMLTGKESIKTNNNNNMKLIDASIKKDKPKDGLREPKMIDTKRDAKKEIMNSNDVSSPRTTRQIQSQAQKEKSINQKEKKVKRQNVKELHRSPKKFKADNFENQSVTSTVHKPNGFYRNLNMYGFGIVKSRFNIIPRHCNKSRFELGDDSKSVISSSASTILTRSRTFLHAF